MSTVIGLWSDMPFLSDLFNVFSVFPLKGRQNFPTGLTKNQSSLKYATILGSSSL